MYIPVKAEKIGTSDAPSKNNLKLERANDYEFMKYMSPPAFTTQTSESSSEDQGDLVDLIAVETEVENKTPEEGENRNKGVSIWPESTINTTYQANWIG